MGYVGRGLNQDGGQYRKLDSIATSFNGSETNFTLTIDGLEVTPTAQNLMISLGGVIQEPGTAFTVNGSTITFASAPADATTFFGVLMGEATFIARGTVGAAEMGITAGAVSASAGVVVDSSKNVIGFNEISASIFKGSFSGDTSSSIDTRINSLVTDSGSFSTRITNATASINSISSSQATRTANLVIASSSLSASVATLKGSGTLQSVATNASPTFAGATITGTLTAQEVHTEFESASILFSSGSTLFGNSSDDVHEFKGNTVSGSGTSTGSFGSAHFRGVGGVGIGTNNPTVALEVFGSADQQIRIDSTGNRAQLQFDGKKTSNAEFAEINFANDGDSAAAIHAMRDGANDAARLAFFTQPTGGSVTERMSIDSSGFVGIGTDNPGSYYSDFNNLVVYENGNAGIAIIGGTNGESSLGFGDGTGAATYRGAVAYVHTSGANQDKMFFKTSATNQVVIDSSGQVGIGTLAPGNPLHLYSDTYPQLSIDGTDNSGNIGFVLSGSGGRGGMRWNGSNNDVEILREGGGVEVSLLDGGNVTFANWIYVNNRVMGASGDVRVASNDGNEMLHLLENGTAKIDVGGSTKMFINSDGVTVGGSSAPQRALHVQGATGLCLSDGDRDRAALLPVSPSAPNGGLAINVRSGSASHERIRVDYLGNVGIGTNSPDFKFHVYNASDSEIFWGQDAGGVFQSVGTNQHFRFLYDNGNSEAVRIEDGGNVGIGTTNPGEKVHVYGGAGTTLKIEVTGGNDAKMDFKTTTTEYRMGANIGGVGNDTFSIKDMQAGGGTERVRIDSGGDFYTNDGSVSSLSDRRAKKDILDLEDGLSIINQLRPRTFKYNGRTVRPDDGVTRYGFIADEVLEVASQYVNIGEELLDGEMVDDFKTLSPTRMIPMMIKAIQELSTEVQSLKAQVSGSN